VAERGTMSSRAASATMRSGRSLCEMTRSARACAGVSPTGARCSADRCRIRLPSRKNRSASCAVELSGVVTVGSWYSGLRSLAADTRLRV
jgi:hypothetical protein